MSVFHFQKPRERRCRKELLDFLIDKIDDNYYEEFLKLLDRYRQAIFNHGVAAEREEKESLQMIVYAFMYYICDFDISSDWITDGMFSTKEKAEKRAEEWLQNYKDTDEDGYVAHVKIQEWAVM